jgi:serine/threonine-protein kinase
LLRDHVIQVGQVLDKYELLERVGQGGMAVVYRGVDRQLKRVVAIKVLHKHLADYQEARDRFEREAQAVAKLRHENILEIFDYSGADAAEAAGSSYIVTEFIDGETLRQRMIDRPMAFPEIGALVMLQVCRALGHAHSVGILHRDIKPENIMIRSDGVVKLMDFGISHMVDLERLTVTGQLLGSPAYMAPEHVEGRPLDARTDVFAVGIVLYQLAVGKLPFEGKNPHEVLKRIAECRFTDPRQANPRIGNRLGRIILRAMAAQPGDRFAQITEMASALEGYLEESGIAHDKVAGELGRYVEDPADYERALKQRLLAHLTERGERQLGHGDRAQALDIFDRILTIDPHNPKVLEVLARIHRRRRWRSHAIAAAAVAALAAGVWAMERHAQPPEADPPPNWTTGSGAPAFEPRRTEVAQVELPAPAAIPPAVSPAIDAAPSADPADPPLAPGAPPATPAHSPATGAAATGAAATGAAATGPRIATQIRVSPAKGAEYSVGSAPRQAVPEDGVIRLDLAAETELRLFSLTKCCQEESRVVAPGADITVVMPYLPGRVLPLCSEHPAAEVRITGVNSSLGAVSANLGRAFVVPIGDSTDETKPVVVEFLGEHVDPSPIKVTVEAGKTREVKCTAVP